MDIENKKLIWDRVMSHCMPDLTTGCLLWMGYTHESGHGMVRVDGKLIYAHRISAYIHGIIDSLDDERNINHKIECPNKNCINYEHVYAGTQSENMRDIKVSGSSLKRFCKRGHALIPQNMNNSSKGYRECKLCRRIVNSAPKSKENRLKYQAERRRLQKEYKLKKLKEINVTSTKT